MKSKFLFLFFLSHISLFFLIGTEDKLIASPLKINIITHCNGAGLVTDYDLLSSALTQRGHHVQGYEWHDKKIPSADINIFFEYIPHEPSLSLINWFVPNPEWFLNRFEDLSPFDFILCRTHEVESIFKKHNQKTFFLGFTSPDCYHPEIPKDYSKILHLGGFSSQKGTQTILNIWKENPLLPELHLITHLNWQFPAPLHNLKLFTQRLNQSDLRYIQNHCGIHLCPSETEGFGHYIMEGMSTGAVILTTNAPPMNEFINEPLCLVPFSKVAQQRLATCYFVDPNYLESQIVSVNQLSKEDLERIGKENREKFLKMGELFYERLSLLLEMANEQLLSNPLRKERI